MASNYSSGIAIELMGSGDQESTWGETTNDNLRRLEQGIVQYAEVTLTGTTTNWTLSNTAASYSADSQGRAAYVKFIDGGDLGGTATVNIRGNDVSTYPYRCFFASNGLTEQDLILASGSGGTVTLPNGYSALVYTDGITDTAGVVKGVPNLSIDKVSLENGETIENSTNDQIDITSDTVRVGAGDANATVKSSGNFDLILSSGRSSNASVINIDGAVADGDIEIFPASSGGDAVVKFPVGSYINFGATGAGSSGDSGYGIWDDGGSIKIKNSGGSWNTPAAGVGEFSESYVSSQQALFWEGVQAFEHGFNPNKPTVIEVVLICTDATNSGPDKGYSVGMEVGMGSGGGGGTYTYGGLGTVSDATYVTVVMMQKISLPDLTVSPTSRYFDIESGSDYENEFEIIVRAWR